MTSGLRLAVFYPWQEGAGGDPAYFRHLCDALAREGVATVVLCRDGQYKPGEPLVQPRYPRGRAPLMLSDLADLHRFLRAERGAIAALVMVGCFSPFNAAAALLARLHGVPYVVSPEGTVSPAAFTHGRRLTKRFYWHLIERPILAQAAAVRVLSDFEEASLRAMGIRTPMFVAREGPELDALAAYPSYTRSRRTAEHFVFLGRLDIWQKALDNVVRGFAEARREIGNGLRLTLAGPPLEGAEGRLRDLFAREGLVEGRDVHLSPPVYGTAKWDLLRSADVFLHPSRNEGIPRSVVEALTMGVPVIVTAETNLGTVVEQTAAGWQVQATAEGVAQGIRAAAAAPDLERRAARAAELARTELAWQSIAQSFAGSLGAILTNAGRTREGGP
jgi:glycosyltransferase involved in cell wall biosynthesis